jgi:hypothetical protein
VTGDYDIPECWLLVTGDPFSNRDGEGGLNFTGPFDDSEDASNYAELHYADTQWWVIKADTPRPLETPPWEEGMEIRVVGSMGVQVIDKVVEAPGYRGQQTLTVGGLTFTVDADGNDRHGNKLAHRVRAPILL